MLNFCSRIGCILKAMINKANSNIFTEENVKTEEIKEQVEELKPINITIHKPLYEYAHGKKFKTNPTWIVVHYTGCANVSAKSMCKSMKNNSSASSHFYIDEKDIYAAVPLKYIAWHVGDGKCKQPEAYNKKSLEELSIYNAKDWRYDLAASNHLKWIAEGNDFSGNSQSIGVDICVKKKNTDTKKATDEDWYFLDEAVENTAKVVAYLAKEYSIDVSHIIRHSDSTGKLCPRPFVTILKGEVNDEKWESFKGKVAEYMKHDIIIKNV